MIKFKDLIQDLSLQQKIEDASVTLGFEGTDRSLSLKFNSKDLILNATYTGTPNPWFASLCVMLIGKNLHQALAFSPKNWETVYRDDQSFWDLKQETEEDLFQRPLELLKASLNIFRGRDYLYREESPLICRCFGVREKDVLEHLQKNEAPTLESLCGETKAGMGCRSCIPQLKRWVALHEPHRSKHHYKEKPISEWILEIDYMLSCYPLSEEWKMELKGFKGKQVSISFDKEVTQKEEEETSKHLQDFLGAAVDPDLGFFLRRARHFSKAKG